MQSTRLALWDEWRATGEEFDAELEVALGEDGVDRGRLQVLGEGEDGGGDVAVARHLLTQALAADKVSSSARDRSSDITDLDRRRPAGRGRQLLVGVAEPEPPSLPGIRTYQRAYADATLLWARRGVAG